MSELPSLPEQLNRLSRENERLRRENQNLALLRTIARTIVDEPDKAQLTMRLAEHLKAENRRGVQQRKWRKRVPMSSLSKRLEFTSRFEFL